MNCPKCNEELDEDSTFCSSCGEKIETVDLKKCPSCGTSNKSDASFCNSCGYNFTTPQKIESNEVFVNISDGVNILVRFINRGTIALSSNGIIYSRFPFIDDKQYTQS